MKYLPEEDEKNIREAFYDKARKVTMMEWKPIETAPKDESRILLYEKGSMCVGHWWNNYDGWALKVLCIDNPTHWMPLPEPPSELQEGK